jgi:hypothetical protein
VRPGARLISVTSLLIAVLLGCTANPPLPLTPSPEPASPSPSPIRPVSPPTSPGQPTTAPPTATPTEPPPAKIDVAWALGSTHSEFSPFDVISDATASGPALVAVGSYDDGTPLGGGAAWRSEDGLVWQRASEVPASGRATMEAVALGMAGFVAVGFRDDGARIRPAAWLSADGDVWEFVEDADFVRGQMSAVAANALGYVALGFDAETEEGLAWLSRDGLDWSAAIPVPSFGIQPSINHVVAIGDGFVAHGFTALSERAALWTSFDGREWERVAGLPTSPNSNINGLVSSGTRLVAVGAGYLDEGTIALAWASDNGIDWEWVLGEDAAEPGEMLSVVPVGPGFLAVGSAGEGQRDDFRAAVWWSADGHSWQRAPTEPSFERARMSQILRAGPGLVALGEQVDDPAGEMFRPAVWLGIPR